MPVRGGTLTLADLLNTTQQTAADFDPSRIYDAFNASLAAWDTLLQEQLAEFSSDTTERLVGTGGTTQIDFEDADEASSPRSQRVVAGLTFGFPLRAAQAGTGWTDLTFEEATPKDLAVQYTAILEAYRRRVIRDLKRAIYTPTNYTFVDVRKADKASIPVKALLNADAAWPIPPGPNGEVFPTSHNHYIFSAALDNTAVTNLVETVIEHYRDPDVRIVCTRANGATISGLAGFVPYQYSNVVPATTTTYNTADILNPYRLFNRPIGTFNGVEVLVKPWAIAGYVVAYNRRVRVLRRRIRRAGYGSLREISRDKQQPLNGLAYECEYGFGVSERQGAAVLCIGGSYTAPTIT